MLCYISDILCYISDTLYYISDMLCYISGALCYISCTCRYVEGTLCYVNVHCAMLVFTSLKPESGTWVLYGKPFDVQFNCYSPIEKLSNLLIAFLSVFWSCNGRDCM